MPTNRTAVKKFIISNDLYLLPLQSIKDKICTCGKIDCASPGKHPLLPYSWKKIATNDEKRITDWLAKSNVNYGIATGRKSKTNGLYLVVIDIDTANHEILTKLPKTTFHYRTGSGGWHFWFWSKYAASNSASKIAPQVDIRGVGGYVVIPPSIHISGGSYVADFKSNIEIADESIYNIIFSKEKKDTTIKISNQEPNNNSDLLKNSTGIKSHDENLDQIQSWSRENIGIIRARLLDGKRIPAGVRNVLLHRLLSSDRARGLDTNALMITASEYRGMCENSDSVSDRELATLVSQVSKYPTYNSSYEKVNEHYFEIMKRIKRPVSTVEQETIKELDKKYFSNLVITDKGKGSSMHMLVIDREQVFGNKVERFSKYPQHLFAAKLKSLGFERYRTAKGNFWNCRYEVSSNSMT